MDKPLIIYPNPTKPKPVESETGRIKFYPYESKPEKPISKDAKKGRIK